MKIPTLYCLLPFSNFVQACSPSPNLHTHCSFGRLQVYWGLKDFTEFYDVFPSQKLLTCRSHLSLLIRFNKLFQRNARNTDRNGTNKENTHLCTPNTKTLLERLSYYENKWYPYLNTTSYFTNLSLSIILGESIEELWAKLNRFWIDLLLSFTIGMTYMSMQQSCSSLKKPNFFLNYK